MEPDFVAIKGGSEDDPDGSKLGEALSAHLAMERARIARIVRVSWIAALSVPVWLLGLRPQWFSAGARGAVLGAWALSVLLAIRALVTEWRWRSTRDSRVAALRVDPPSDRAQ